MESLEQILQEHPFFAGLPAGARCSSSPVARAIIASMPANICFAKASPPNEFFLIRHGKVALEIDAPGPGADRVRDARRRRDRRRLLAGAALSLDVRCARHGADARHRHRRRLPAREMRGGPPSRLRDDEALPADAREAAARDAGCRSSMSMGSTDAGHGARTPIRSCRSSIGSSGVQPRACPIPSRSSSTPLAGRDRRSSRDSSTCFTPSASAKSPSASAATRRTKPPSCIPCAMLAPSAARSTKLEPGATIGLRGPFGTGWPVEEAEGADVVIVAGGLGLAPLRPAIYQILANRSRYGRVVILFGSRNPERYALPPRAGAVAPAPRCRYRGDRRSRRRRLARQCRRRADADSARRLRSA